MPSRTPDPPSPDVTHLLHGVTHGETGATDELLLVVYEELRRLAHRRLAQEPPGLTLQATALVHEAYLRLVGDRDVHWDNRRHFFVAAGRAMRRILVERARRHHRLRHGDGREPVPLEEVEVPAAPEVDLLALDEALGQLEAHDPRMADIVALRFFAGLGVEETATALGVSPRTVKRDWGCARAWLYDRLQGRSDA